MWHRAGRAGWRLIVKERVLSSQGLGQPYFILAPGNFNGAKLPQEVLISSRRVPCCDQIVIHLPGVKDDLFQAQGVKHCPHLILRTMAV